MASSNTGTSRLDVKAAIDSILIQPETEKSAPPKDEVTAEAVETEVTEVTTAEAATTTENVAPDHNQEVAEAEAADELVEEEVTETEASEETVEEEVPPETQEEPETVAEEVEEVEETDPVFMTLQDGTEVTPDEAKKGYLRQQDYTQKTQTLAEERQSFVTEKQGFGEQQNAAAEAIMFAMNIVEPQLVQGSQTDWNTLMNDDAYAHAEQWASYQQAQHRYTQLQGAAQALTQQNQAQQVEASKAYQAEQAKALTMAIPDLADPKKGKALQTQLREYALSTGLTDAEATGIKDHRVIVMMNKARLYDELMSARKTVVKKKLAKSPKKVVTPGKPVTKSETQAKAKADKLANVKKYKSVDAGVDWLLTGQ